MKKIFLSLLLFLLFLPSNPALAQTDEVFEAKVDKIIEEKDSYQKLELSVLNGGKITVENGNLPIANIPHYKVGDKVLVNKSSDENGNEIYYITDFVRNDTLLKLFLIFAVLVIAIGKWRGVTSLIGLAISFLVIFLYILPNLSKGENPIETAIAGSLIIIPVSFFLSHGLNKKTIVAIIGTFCALIITGFLANFFVEAAKLTGFSSEEAGFLQFAKQGTINMKGLLLAGIIIGVLGVLDDITVSQSAIVFQLKQANEKLKFNELFNMAMNVGQDHIASMVNTLVLVYTGAALPLLLLFVDSSKPFSEIINYELIADEIVRTLAGSVGLIMAVPITTFIAALTATLKERRILI